MTKLEQITAVIAKRIFKEILGFKDHFETTSEEADYFHQEASDLIKHGLLSDEPFAVSRFGYSELRTILTLFHIKENRTRLKKLFDFATGLKVEPWWHENTINIITHNAGVFPKDIPTLEKYVATTLDGIENIDVIGSWLGGEKYVKHLMPKTKFMRFHDFYHFLHDNPWTDALKAMRVLVIHPFTESIEKQYARKSLIYNDPHTLPDFELKTIKAVQSIAGNKPEGFLTWFDALEHMKRQINDTDFDVAILGCGAYGMPLAIHIKNIGKKAIHLGGNTQILFGVKGSRWENDTNFSSVINRHWVNPQQNETPRGHNSIDENCYW